MTPDSQRPDDVIVRVIGTISIRSRDGAWHESGPLAANLLLALVLAPGNSQSTAALIESIWGEAIEGDKRPALQTLVSRLRALAGDDVIATRAGGYVLTALSDLDLATVLLAQARAAGSDHDTALARCDEALGLWQGRIGAGASNSELVDDLNAIAQDLRGALREVRVVAGIEIGHVAGILSDIRHLSQEAPYDDTVAELLLRALHLSGRTNEALEAYGEYRARLATDLGSRPTAKLDAYHLALLRENDNPESAPIEADSATPLGETKPVAPPEVMRIGMRTAPNALIGRDDDIRRLTKRLTESRLVTIDGPGGIGKARLASEVAQEASNRGVDVAIVELAGLRSGADVAGAIAATLGVRETQGTHPSASLQRGSRIVELLNSRPTLLVVDNCEHVLNDAARWISEILAQTTRLRILATSRAALGIAGELVYNVDTLVVTGVDGKPGPAVELFNTRAHASRPRAALAEVAMIRLCERLDGLPLAIELAAARTRVMSVEEILDRLTDRLALLSFGDRTAPTRHQSLAAVIEWSWDLLTADQRRLRRFLGVFPYGFSLDAAVAVMDGMDEVAVLNDLDALVSQSLLRVDDGPDGRARFRMLETVREYAVRRLAESGELDQAQGAFLDWARDFAQRIALAMESDDQERAFAEAANEFENILAAMRLAAVRDDPRSVIGCYSMIGTWWAVRAAFGEILEFNGLIMATCASYTPTAEDAQYAVLAFALTELMLLRVGTMREAARARIALRRSLLQAKQMNSTYRVLGEVAICMADQNAMISVARRGIASTDPKEAATSHLLLSLVLENAGDIEESIAMAKRAHAIAESINHLWMRAMAAQARASFDKLRAIGQRGAPELVIVADIGTAEVDRIGGAVADALAAHRDLSARNRYRADPELRPWQLIVDATTIAVHVIEGDADRPELVPLVRNLAEEFIGAGPPPRNAIDFPVLGTVLVGLSAWETHRGYRGGGELLALAEKFSSRQDLPALVRADHFSALAAADHTNPHLGLLSPDTARETVSGLDLPEALARAHELVAEISARELSG